MKRVIVIILVLLVLVGVAAWFGLNYEDLLTTAPEVATVRYDVDADGDVELVRWDLDGSVVLWHWDRDSDDALELVAYDAVVGADGSLTPAGQIVAWDWGADAVIDDGEVPAGVQSFLQREEIAAALRTPPQGELALVGPEIQGLVEQIREGYDDWRLSGLRMPIVGASLPALDTLLPDAPRRYRNGIHQGFDMMPGHVGVPTGYSAPAVAAKDGTVIRADLDYREMTPREHEAALETARQSGTTPTEILDKLRGRQVWIDHGAGIVTRYCHLSGIASGITEGTRVEAGDIVGFVGNSGTEGGVAGTQAGAHLHFELRIDDRYFGEGMSPDQIRERALEIFHIDDRDA